MAQALPISRIVGLLGLFAAAFCFVAPAQAAGLSVAPMFQEVVLGSEREVVAEVTLSNATDTPQTFRLAAYDFGNLDESGGVAFLGASGQLDQAYALSRWMRLSRETVTLQPRGSETVVVTITNDDTLSPGGHYGAVVFESVDSAPSDNANRIAVSQMVASLLFAKKTDGARFGLELNVHEVLGHLLSLSEARLSFKNTGNVHVVPRGRIRVLDPAGRETKRGIINEASSLVLPGQERIVPVVLNPLAWSWLPGWYEIVTEYRYDGDEVFQMVTERRFLVPPASLIFLGGGFLCYGAWQFSRRWRKPANRPEQESI